MILALAATLAGAGGAAGQEADGTAAMPACAEQGTERLGTVAVVNPSTGDRRLGREPTRVWREAEFEPYHIGGRRVAAGINAPLAFSSGRNWTHSTLEVNPVQP